MGEVDRGRLYRLALGEAARALGGAVAAAARRLSVIRAGRPTRVLIAPQDLRTSDPTAATAIYAGHFVFAGRAVAVGGASPFAAPPPSAAWAEALYGFGWLRHLRAADTVLARQNARALIDEFLTRSPADPRLAHGTSTVARRLISFLSQSPLILEGADHAFYQRYLRAVAGAVRELEVAVAAGPPPKDRLAAVIALAYAGLCCEGYDALLRRATRLLERELGRQLLADGGHASRNPDQLLQIVLDLLPLRQSYARRRLDPPEALSRAIDRALPMLRLFRHGDGSLSHFNGMGASAVDHLATLLVYDDPAARAMQHAPHSGYERLEAGKTLLVADIGRPPPIPFSAAAQAGCLSFELSSGPHRLIVNCGAPRGPHQAVQAARATAAHSTATLAGLSSCQFLGGKGGLLHRWLVRRWGCAVVAGPERVTLDRARREGCALVAASHDGYRARLGLVHERRWELSSDGTYLLGEDVFRPDPGAAAVEAAIRFHLHPAVRSRPTEEGTILLTLPNGEEWRFSAWGAELHLEESVFFAASEGARRTEQIVLVARTDAPEGVRWRVERLMPAREAALPAAAPDGG